ncbi:recombinase family protein, partial [Altererythrobacter salegens]
MNKVRCAIYTRKSSEEGLEQDFNSLHAQREACAAYVLSQASEGWSLLPGDYDDGGLSGGTLERPALQRLLADIEAGKIDIVVVYKVDRLTRSLLDFAKLVETMDKAGVSFVSVTQSFNTTNSMGRLTLNMLLSFAQFEREVTAERIRDKIAASKAKGMWMGGVPPLGYEPDGRSLKVVGEHAAVIRDLFHRYLDTGNVRLLVEQLHREGSMIPQRTLATGRTIGGGAFSRGQVYKILSNPIYLGEIHHRGQVYPGRHEAIVDRASWDAVQAKLNDNAQGAQTATSVRATSKLAGLVFDDTAAPLVASHACKGKVRYRYYVSKALQHAPGSGSGGMRIPALELEKAVAETIAARFDNPLELVNAVSLQLAPDHIVQAADRCKEIASRLRKREARLMRTLVKRVTIAATTIEVSLDAEAIASMLDGVLAPGAATNYDLRIDAAIRRTGRAVHVVHDNG